MFNEIPIMEFSGTRDGIKTYNTYMLENEKPNNTVYTWQGFIEGNCTYTKYGYRGKKITTSSLKVFEDNRASLGVDRAYKYIVKEFNNKLLEKYSCPDADIFNSTISPMLATTLETSEIDTLDYPVYLSPKLDGVRCIAYMLDDGSVIMQSRNGKPIEHCNHIRKQLSSMLEDNIVIDGELYCPGMEFNEISGISRSKSADDSEIELHIFDIINKDKPDMPYKKRYSYIVKNYSSLESISVVPSYLAENSDDFHVHHEEFTNDGYEGTMVRVIKGIYENKRSKNLLKYKEFVDDEFEIVDIVSGKGKNKDCATLVLKYDKKRTFNATGKFTIARKQEIYANKEDYIGLMAVVKYQPSVKDVLPRFPVVLRIRDYE